MTDKKIFLVQRSFSKEKTSGKDRLIIDKGKLRKMTLGETMDFYVREEFAGRRGRLWWKKWDEIRPILEASLMHVSEEEKCAELTQQIIQDFVEDCYEEHDRSGCSWDLAIKVAFNRFMEKVA